MLQSVSSVFVVYSKTLTGSPDAKHANGTDKTLHNWWRIQPVGSVHRFSRDLTVSTAPTQSSRDSNTISISDNSATRKSNPGIHTGITTGITTDTPSTPTTSPVETGVTAIPEEIPEEIQIHSSNYRSVIPTDTQALTALQN